MLSQVSEFSPVFRRATASDCASLVLLADMATRGLTTFLWGESCAPGQPPSTIGRNLIRNDQANLTHYSRWRVAEHRGEVIGGFNAYLIPPDMNVMSGSAIVRPLNELKAMVAGSWYISAIAIFPEFQERGVGKTLLAEAENQARSAGNSTLSLMVGSFNPNAFALYAKAGFEEKARRPFLPFSGSDEPGEWILMIKTLS